MAPREDTWRKTTLTNKPHTLLNSKEPSGKGFLATIKNKIPLNIAALHNKTISLSGVKNIMPEIALIRVSQERIIHSDIISIILPHANAATLTALRQCTKKWKKIVDKHPEFWKKVELEKIRGEFPKSILEVFGGAESIQKMEFIDLNQGKYRELFRQKTGKDKVEKENVILSLAESYNKRITWITHSTFKGKSIFRGIDPYGCHFICMKVFRGNKNPMVLIFQEDAPAFRSQRKDKTFGWVSTTLELTDGLGFHRVSSYPTPLIPNRTKESDVNETVCIFRNSKEESFLTDEIIEKIKALIAGETIVTIYDGGRQNYTMKP